MPALQRAIALEEVDDVAVLVAEDLHFDVPRLLDVLLEVDAAVLERGLGLGSRLVERRESVRPRRGRRACRGRRRRPPP